MGGARSLIVRSSLALRHAIKNTVRPLFNHHIHSRISKPSLLAVTLASSQLPSLHSSHHSRSLCSASASPGVVLVNSEEEFNNILSKVQDNSLHAIFYFTAVWCGPCLYIDVDFTTTRPRGCWEYPQDLLIENVKKLKNRFISPIVGELSKKYPHVTTYKIDIDQEAIQGALGKLQITSVPTLHFFHNGKKADELIGADVTRLNHITEKLFKKD